jgi:hypothetical protein
MRCQIVVLRDKLEKNIDRAPIYSVVEERRH